VSQRPQNTERRIPTALHATAFVRSGVCFLLGASVRLPRGSVTSHTRLPRPPLISADGSSVATWGVHVRRLDNQPVCDTSPVVRSAAAAVTNDGLVAGADLISVNDRPSVRLTRSRRTTLFAEGLFNSATRMRSVGRGQRATRRPSDRPTSQWDDKVDRMPRTWSRADDRV
jgi:hypothetical protein